MDLVIVGTGVSAMLLAESLIRHGCFDTLKLVGPEQPLRAHRLSYWSDAPTPFDAFADGCWSELRVFGSDGREARSLLSRLRYRSLPARAWHGALQREVLAARGVERVVARAESLASEGKRATVRTDRGPVKGDWVFSSAPLSVPEATAWQRFEGWEVHLSGRELDPSAATLLDFRVPTEGDVRFLYVLPLGARRLFVEHVSYWPTSHERALAAYLNDVLGVGGWEVVDRERGATPLYSDPPVRTDGRVVRIGVGAGVAKAATGYALMRMCRDAEAIARSLRSSGRPAFVRRPAWLYRVADHFFIHLLKHAPERLPTLLTALFSRASGDAVLAFLDDRATPLQQIEVARAMPGWLGWWAARR